MVPIIVSSYNGHWSSYSAIAEHSRHILTKLNFFQIKAYITHFIHLEIFPEYNLVSKNSPAQTEYLGPHVGQVGTPLFFGVGDGGNY